MALILGLNNNIVYFGPRDNPKCQRWWAERGLIHMEDARDNSYITLNIREFLERLQGVNDMIGNSKTAAVNDGFAHSDEIGRQQKFIEEAVELVKVAKEQGEAGSKDAVKDAKRRRSKTIVMPGSTTF